MKLTGFALCAVGALVGCGGSDDVGEPAQGPLVQEPMPAEGRDITKTEGSTALANVEKNLARLEALEVFEVGELLVQVPDQASACYGVVCPDELVEEATEAAAQRLEAFVEIAEQAAAEPSGYLCTELVDANLDALRALEVVEVVGMIEAVPENDPQCYNLPCQDDIDAANAANEMRAAKLDSIARAAEGL